MKKPPLECGKPIRFGLVGAGAIAQHAYLPAMIGLSYADLTAIVDTNLVTLNNLVEKYTLGYIGPDITSCLDYVDAVIVAVPNYLHFPICEIFLKAGKHVLCEKPITNSTGSAYDLVDCARRNDVKLAVAHIRRFYPSSRLVKQIIKERRLGNIIGFDCQEGVVFSWPTTSRVFFDREKAGGGVLMDIGVHLLDLLMWWFDSEPSILTYEDDNLGGVEAFSKMKLRYHNSINGSVRLSRLSQLRNTYLIKCKTGTIEYDPFDMSSFSIYDNETPTEKRQKTNRTTKKSFTFVDAVKAMLQDFCDAVHENSDPLVTGLEGARVIEFIQECYKNRQQIKMPWL
jgi:predicted dehydrogenase